MSTTTESSTASVAQTPAVSLFQRAHQKMQMLQRIDAQVSSLLEQRQKAQDELRSVQLELNEEIDKVARSAEENGASSRRIRPVIIAHDEDEAPMMHLTAAVA